MEVSPGRFFFVRFRNVCVWAVVSGFELHQVLDVLKLDLCCGAITDFGFTNGVCFVVALETHTN